MRLALPQTEESVKCSSYRLTPSTNIDVKHPTLIQVCVHFSLKKCGGGGGGEGRRDLKVVVPEGSYR